jgi:hypothetical protein
MTSQDGRLNSVNGMTTESGAITPVMDRLNKWIFFVSYVLTYLAAPVLYVDVVQAALCHKLGASTTLANLPASAYLFGSFAPLILSWKIPYRLERYTVVAANWVTAILLVGVFAALYLPLNDRTRIAAVIFQGLMQGISTAVSQVYTFQCLGRGMTVEGRARCMKLTFTFAPIAAVTGSIGAQFVLTHGVRSLNYPYDFALLYLIGAVLQALQKYAGRVAVANPLQVRLIAEARVKTDKIGAAILAQLYASGFLPKVWIPDESTQALRREG